MDQKQFCMNCGNQVDLTAEVCPACGTPMPKMSAPNNAAPVNAAPMKQFCASCGNTIEGNVSNCPNCGAPVANIPISGNAAAMNGKQTNLLIPLIAGVAAIVLIIVGCVLIFGGGDKEEPIESIVKVMEDGDGDAFAALLPESLVDAVIEEEYDDDDDEFYEDCEKQAENIHEELVDAYGDDISVSYDITDEEELSKLELKIYEETFSYLVDDIEIDEGYRLEVEFEIEGDDDEDTDDHTFTVIEVDGDWVTLYLFE